MSLRRAFALVLAVAPLAAHAQIYRCESPNGVVEYSNAAPEGGGRSCKAIELPAVTTIPAPKLPPSATAPAPASRSAASAGSAPRAAPGTGAAAAGGAGTAASAPDGASAGGAAAAAASFPRVDAAAQRSRDADRRRIIEDELRKEEARLAELRAEFSGGEPERRGDERNFQKYLDRVQRLRDDIGRSEGSVSALRRELATIRD